MLIVIYVSMCIDKYIDKLIGLMKFGVVDCLLYLSNPFNGKID